MIYVLLDESGVVVQRQPYPDDGFVEAPDTVVCGMVHVGDGVFQLPIIELPPPEVPQVVTPAQAMIALESMGLLDEIESWVATQPRATRIAWERVQEFRRDSPALLAGADALGWTALQLDDVFTAAAAVVI